jgi:hypothetical protein
MRTKHSCGRRAFANSAEVVRVTVRRIVSVDDRDRRRWFLPLPHRSFCPFQRLRNLHNGRLRLRVRLEFTHIVVDGLRTRVFFFAITSAPVDRSHRRAGQCAGQCRVRSARGRSLAGPSRATNEFGAPRQLHWNLRIKIHIVLWTRARFARSSTSTWTRSTLSVEQRDNPALKGNPCGELSDIHPSSNFQNRQRGS